MNVYIESNFVLELVFAQEQHARCEEILSLCESGQASLCIPAYSIAEPYEKLFRQRSQRSNLKKRQLDPELQQLRRSAKYAEAVQELESLDTTLLIQSAEEEARRMEAVRKHVLDVAHVIPLDRNVLSLATEYQVRHGLSPQDALVYASVITHLQNYLPAVSCFISTNVRDFGDPDIGRELEQFNCRMFSRFEAGCGYLRGNTRS